eukprot:544289-Pyramimonas_sp.AAC.1
MWFSHVYQDKFERKWQEIETQNSDRALQDGGDIAERRTKRARRALEGGTAAEEPEEDLEEEPEEDPEGGPEEDSDGKPTPVKKEKSEAHVLLAACRKMIVSVQSTLASARSLVEDIALPENTEDEAAMAAAEEWAWARTDAVQGKIESSLKEIEGIVRKNKLWQKLLIGVSAQQVRRRQ